MQQWAGRDFKSAYTIPYLIWLFFRDWVQKAESQKGRIFEELAKKKLGDFVLTIETLSPRSVTLIDDNSGILYLP